MPSWTSLSLIIRIVSGNVSISRKLQFFPFPSSENRVGWSQASHQAFTRTALPWVMPCYYSTPLTHYYITPLKDTETLENYVDRWKLNTLLHIHQHYTEELKLTLKRVASTIHTCRAAQTPQKCTDTKFHAISAALQTEISELAITLDSCTWADVTAVKLQFSWFHLLLISTSNRTKKLQLFTHLSHLVFVLQTIAK